MEFANRIIWTSFRYRVDETEAEEKDRLSNWEEFLEKDEETEKSEKADEKAVAEEPTAAATTAATE